LFHSSAIAAGENTAPISAKPNTAVVAVLKKLICFLSFNSRNLCDRIFALVSGTMPANLGGIWPHVTNEKHSEVHRHYCAKKGGSFV
jgi:hypothetical protein